jgi:predicted MPP superfamily phosphohydrolase
MLDHEPTVFVNEAAAQVDLVLSGHTHGGQMFPIGITGELSGANDMTIGMKTIKKTTFIVNSGISNWAIKFKTGGAISEIGVIDISQK